MVAENLERLRILAKRGDKEACKALLRSARRRNDDTDKTTALGGALWGEGVLYDESAARKCQRGSLYAPLWMEKNRRVLATIISGNWQGSCKVLSFDFSQQLFFLHSWSWGSCESCDGYMIACEELYREDNYPDTEPSQYLSQADLDEQFRKSLEIHSTSYTTEEFLKLRELYLSQNNPHHMIDVIGHVLGFVEDAPYEDDTEFKFYVRLTDMGLPGQPSAEKILEQRQRKAHNKKNKFSNNPFANVLKNRTIH